MTRRPASKLLPRSVVLAMLALSGCTSTDPTMGLTPRASVGSASTYAAPPAQVPQQFAAEAIPAAATVPGSGSPVQFLPIIGAPETTVAQLAEALSTNAAANGVEIVPASDGTAPKRLKGYLSAFGDGSGTTVVYVWDVIGPDGERINRIQGQETVAGSASDPWQAIGADTLNAIALRTLRETATL